MMTVAEARRFRPAPFLAEEDLPDDFVQPDLVILNQPIANFDVFARIWRHTRYRICADGGANRLYDMFQGALEVQRKDYVRAFWLAIGPAQILTTNSCQTVFTVTWTPSAKMSGNIMHPTVLKSQRTPTSITQTLRNR